MFGLHVHYITTIITFPVPGKKKKKLGSLMSSLPAVLSHPTYTQWLEESPWWLLSFWVHGHV